MSGFIRFRAWSDYNHRWGEKHEVRLRASQVVSVEEAWDELGSADRDIWQVSIIDDCWYVDRETALMLERAAIGDPADLTDHELQGEYEMTEARLVRLHAEIQRRQR